VPQSAFTPGKLRFIEPEQWKNVGVNIMYAFKLMIEHFQDNVHPPIQ
jgi:hypothetical protein